MQRYTFWASEPHERRHTGFYVNDQLSLIARSVHESQWYRAEDVDAALAAKDERIAELEANVEELYEENGTLRMALSCRDERIAELEEKVAWWEASHDEASKPQLDLLRAIRERDEFKDKRIAELEALVGAYQEGAVKATITINRLRAERVPDDVLDYVEFACRFNKVPGHEELTRILVLRDANRKEAQSGEGMPLAWDASDHLNKTKEADDGLD